MERPKHRVQSRWRASLSVALVLAIAGLMFAANAQLQGGDAGRHPQNLAGLVQARTAQVAELTANVEALNAEVVALTESANITIPQLTKQKQWASDVVVGLAEVRGPGIKVTLNDASGGIAAPGAAPDDLVVHQQDIQAAVNALWRGGAEAMSIQGQRVNTMTAVRCVGNVLFLHGQVYSPPYQIEAIGNPANMQAALDGDREIRIYQEYVAAYGLGWKTAQSNRITIPASSGPGILRSANIPLGTEVY